MSISEDGPYLTAALICEKVLIEQDNVPTAIRIVDRLIHQTLTIVRVSDAPIPPESEPDPVNLTLFISLKSGKALGAHQVKIVLEPPSGIKTRPQELPILFEGDDKGSNLILPFKFKPDPQGLYWFHISLDDEFLTRIPLRVIHQRSVINQ